MAKISEVSSAQVEWLRREVAVWRGEGLVDDAGAASILGRYTASRRTTVVRLISVLGAAFVGVGLISLVASNLDDLSPTVRFVGIVVVWLGALGAAEVLRRRQPDHGASGAEGGGADRSVAVGVARVIAVAAYGATIFQAAQSLQVPAYSSGLLGCWAGGALAYAYASRAVGPLLVGIATLVGWYAWALGERAGDGASFLVGLLVAAVVATAVGAVHEQGGGEMRLFGLPWSIAAAVLALFTLFVAALPDVAREGLDLPSAGIAGLVVALLAAAAAAVRADTQSRREIAAVVAMLGAGLLLAAWAPADVTDELTSDELLHAIVGTVVYLSTSIWFAVVGAVRERPQLTNLATAALVLFVTVQSFGVFAPLLSGAALFLFLGVILIAVGAVADRGRRRLIEEVAE
ncbi:MAG TPA: DUF2157 domain-containing protein [Mycobacteriales bacterium]|nr:DUF2157 domain-containing protein [Mycobacteriales bacterium]